VQSDRSRFGLPKDRKLVLFAGDMTEPGGAETVAAALERIPDLHGVFAYRDKGSTTADIRSIVESRLGSRAIMLGEVDDFASLVRSVDLQCLPASDLTGKVDFPYVILQSMALGTPVAVGDMAPLNELGDEEDGVLRVSYSPRHLARQIERFLKDADRQTALVAAARKSVESRFSLQNLGKAYAEIYDELSS
jgi:teichuronic acid biosynthesis glycosyltransferase TuaC